MCEGSAAFEPPVAQRSPQQFDCDVQIEIVRQLSGPLRAAEPLFVLCAAGQTAGVALIAVLPPPAVLFAASLLVGVAFGPISPLTGVVVAERTPGPLRARVFGAVAAPVQPATPLGVILGGALLAAFQIGPVLAAAALCCAAVTLAQLRSRALRDLDAPEARAGHGTVQARS